MGKYLQKNCIIVIYVHLSSEVTSAETLLVRSLWGTVNIVVTPSVGTVLSGI